METATNQTYMGCHFPHIVDLVMYMGSQFPQMLNAHVWRARLLGVFFFVQFFSFVPVFDDVNLYINLYKGSGRRTDHVLEKQ
jgi:hypothetical protein